MSDSDWAGQNRIGETKIRKPQTGISLHLGGGAIAWMSRLQSIRALSTPEAEIIAATEGVKLLTSLSIRHLLTEIHAIDLIGQSHKNNATPCLTDNQTAIHMSRNATNERSRHIDLRVEYTRENFQRQIVYFYYTPTDQNPSDCFTKGSLTKDDFQRQRKWLLGDEPIPEGVEFRS